MDKHSINILIVCACGGGLGALISLHAGIFWPIGLIVGMVFGYIGYDWQEAYRVFRYQMSQEIIIPVFVWLKSFFWLCFYRSLRAKTITHLMLFGNIIYNILYPSSDIYLTTIGFVVVLEIGPWGFFAIHNLSCDESVFSRWDLEDSNQEVSSLGVFDWFHQRQNIFEIKIDYFHPTYFLACLISPCYTYFFMGIMAFWASKWTLSFLGKCLISLPRATWLTFKYIHSERRVLCAVDSGLGALIGFMAGSPIVGAFIGGVIGVINYEIISKKILRLY